MGEEQLRAILRQLLHHGAIAELLDQTVPALDSRVRDLGDFVAVIGRPAATSDQLDEANYVLGPGEIDKCVADIAVISEVDTEVHEVVKTEALSNGIHGLLQLGRRDAVGDVAQHDCRADILSHVDLVQINHIVHVGMIVAATARRAATHRSGHRTIVAGTMEEFHGGCRLFVLTTESSAILAFVIRALPFPHRLDRVNALHFHRMDWTDRWIVGPRRPGQVRLAFKLLMLGTVSVRLSNPKCYGPCLPSQALHSRT